ncbi:phospholipase A and acyltransferase 4-like [Anableps anableps]
MLRTVQDTFSSGVDDLTTTLFPTESDPEHPAVSDFRKENKDLQELLWSCGGRSAVLNIKDGQQIPELMDIEEKENTEGRRSFTADQNGDEPKPGDLIEIFRNVYEHWAVYVGGGDVVHLLGPDGNFSSFSTINLPMGKNNILKQKLLEVVGSDEWTINNILDQEKKPRPAEVIVREANKLVGTTKSYNVVDYNCEHFATELRYGNAESQQVEDALKIGLGVTGVSVAVGVAIVALLIWKINQSSSS